MPNGVVRRERVLPQRQLPILAEARLCAVVAAVARAGPTRRPRQLSLVVRVVDLVPTLLVAGVLSARTVLHPRAGVMVLLQTAGAVVLAEVAVGRPSQQAPLAVTVATVASVEVGAVEVASA